MPARAVRNRTVGYYVQSGFMLTVCVCVCVCASLSPASRQGNASCDVYEQRGVEFQTTGARSRVRPQMTDRQSARPGLRVNYDSLVKVLVQTVLPAKLYIHSITLADC